ncbi:MAG: sigma-70 family RNA polymerase sigma factor, partial [Acidobacteria bacterium]|nr:sigma-70 family RNA polymerase sigma factor [Acidobacteriota bacterium]
MLDRLRQVFERCQRRYPTIGLAFEDLAAHVHQIVESEAVHPEGISDLVDRLHHEDLFLALACSRGDRIAWEYFVDEYLPLVQRYAGQACRNMAESEDLAQEIVAGLLDDRRRFAGYNGRGSLAGWLRVSVSHAAIDRFRRNRREVPLDEAGDERDLADPGLRASGLGTADRLDARWGPALLAVLSEEIGQLSSRDRLLLGLYYIEGVPLRLVGDHFGVHEATASRWLDALRRGLR